MIEADFKDTPEHLDESEWLTELLRQSFQDQGDTETPLTKPSEDFHQRCEMAADAAFAITKLRNERRRIGFIPISLAEYLQGLMNITGAQIEAVLLRFGIDEVKNVTSESARKFARLAQELEISLREFLIHVRIGFVERIDSTPVPLLLAHHRSAGIRDQLSECEVVLGIAEAEYDGELLNELRRTEFEIRAAYKQGEKP